MPTTWAPGSLSPVHTHARQLPLDPGQAVPIDIAIWPHGIILHAGERLQLVISGHDLEPDMAALDANDHDTQPGTHRIRTGPTYDSHLLIPVVPDEESTVR